MLQILFLLAFPLLVACGVSLLAWNSLSAPWRFLSIATVVLYALYGACMYFLAPASAGFAVHAAGPAQPGAVEPVFVFLAPYYKPLLSFSLLAVLASFALLRAFKR